MEKITQRQFANAVLLILASINISTKVIIEPDKIPFFAVVILVITGILYSKIMYFEK
ncbi:hypothetical protein LCGC14_2213510 [marine sediment metagenome]|uniref:Uncharacterized protein n=1 Tax=marine sediment metagenome TaxID=412755 RepID=A0A0F9DD80_9ZZZZ